MHASTTLKVRRLRFRALGCTRAETCIPLLPLSMFLRVSGQFEARGESERPSIIDQAMNRRESTLAARSLANTTINTDRHCCDGWAEQPIIPQRRGGGSRSPARWSLARSVGRSVGRWASVLLASSDDTNRAGNYVTMPRPNLAATWPPMNTVWEYFITLLEICGGEGKFNSFHFSPPPLSTLETASISIRFFFYYRPPPPTVCDSMKKGGGERGGKRGVALSRFFLTHSLLWRARDLSTRRVTRRDNGGGRMM